MTLTDRHSQASEMALNVRSATAQGSTPGASTDGATNGPGITSLVRCAACARCNAARLTARAESEGWDAWDDLTRPPLGRRWHHAPGSGRSWRGWPWTDPPATAEVAPSFRCASPNCPGLPYRASDQPHPPGCGTAVRRAS